MQDLVALSELKIARDSIRVQYEAAKKVRKFAAKQYEEIPFWNEIIVAYEALDTTVKHIEKTLKNLKPGDN